MSTSISHVQIDLGRSAPDDSFFGNGHAQPCLSAVLPRGKEDAVA